MTLARVLANAGVVKNRLLTEARLSTDPYIIVARTEEAAALEHLMAIARPLLRPTPSPDLAEAMVDHAARLGTAIQDALALPRQQVESWKDEHGGKS
jgi:hypothetical protein